MKKIKFIIIAGSSAGHILPAIKYINNLSDIKAPNEILFITNEIGKNYIEKIKNDKINKLIVINHKDCGAAKIANGGKKFTSSIEYKMHKLSFKSIKIKLKKKHPKLKVNFKILSI